MDKELQKAKEQYQNEVEFTDHDRNQVLEKISEAHQRTPKKRVFHPFPIAAALIATLLIGFLFLSNYDQLFKQNTASPSSESVAGYIVKIEDQRALVTNSENETSIWINDLPDPLDLGHQIEGSYEDHEESAIELNEYEITNNETVEDSRMTKNEAVRIALTEADTSDYERIVIRNVIFNQSEQFWSIGIDVDDSAIIINIDDQTGEILSEEHPEAEEPNLDEVISNYEETITSLKNENTQEIDFDSKDEVMDYLTQAMSYSLAESHIDTYIEERDDGLYLVPTEFPVFINTDEDYQTSQEDANTYHVTQEQDTELTDHIEMTFIITNHDGTWIVDEVEVEQLNQPSIEIESDQQAEEEVERALQLGDQYQYSYEGQKSPSEEYENQNLALIHVYEENDNATATYGWYYINMDTRSIYEYDLANNNLNLRYEYHDGDYVEVE
ncbi:hypothetical protein ACTWQB_03215 [Piscibacillus sp. B03]|uniref:hypothetical protein n=1 Tax=Piscibacillus sp. B03 TaxID=3457430 RepID=UPI003FCED38F